ncbi:uncharacterized protein LOC110068772 [Orbicella faveolata]|uniref:uncharacterized protein LOC110068772 n=1 Tax=Orbicella faveolata TaxID=48498 RepID=UPI0009E43F35|nr:uncharacterized protein LOC110068772 [Orbicella faveolata]XP_020631840.1 uncharacterized protein LOC110068772 [Orbicella faveolata]
MKSILSLCVIFVLVVCYSGSPVAKKSKLVQGIQDFAVESQPRSKRSIELLPGIAKSAAIRFSEAVSKGRNKRSNDVILNALAQLRENQITSHGIAKIFSSDLANSLAEEK